MAWQHLLTFIGSLIGECLIPKGLCWLTTWQWWKRDIELSRGIPCAFFSAPQVEPGPPTPQKISRGCTITPRWLKWYGLPERVTNPPKKGHSPISSKLLKIICVVERGMPITHPLSRERSHRRPLLGTRFCTTWWQEDTREMNSVSPEYAMWPTNRELGQSGFASCDCEPGTCWESGMGLSRCCGWRSLGGVRGGVLAAFVAAQVRWWGRLWEKKAGNIVVTASLLHSAMNNEYLLSIRHSWRCPWSAGNKARKIQSSRSRCFCGKTWNNQEK